MDYTGIPVKCDDGQALVKLNYEHTTNNKDHFFTYECTSYLDYSGEKSLRMATEWNDTQYKENQSFHYLDRHQVKCPESYGLNGFEIQRQENNGDKIRIEYYCSKLTKFKELETRTTAKVGNSGLFGGNNWTQINDFSPEREDSVLNGFVLQDEYDKGFKFWFKLWFYEL